MIVRYESILTRSIRVSLLVKLLVYVICASQNQTSLGCHIHISKTLTLLFCFHALECLIFESSASVTSHFAKPLYGIFVGAVLETNNTKDR